LQKARRRGTEGGACPLGQKEWGAKGADPLRALVVGSRQISGQGPRGGLPALMRGSGEWAPSGEVPERQGLRGG